MSFQVHQGAIQTPAGTGNQGYTGVGFQPKLLIIWEAGLVFTDGYAAFCEMSLGFGISSSSRIVYEFRCGDGLSSTQAFRTQKSTRVLSLSNGAWEADLVSMDADGFTLNWSGTLSSGFQIGYMALGGTDLTDVKIGSFNMNTTTGNQAISTVGFQPDCLLFLGNNMTADASDIAVAKMSLGAAESSTKRWAVAVNAANGQTMTAGVDAMKTERTDSCILGLSDTATLNHRADFVSMDSNGFTVNVLTAPASAWNIFYVALKGGQYEVGANGKPTGAATANQDVTVGFQPTGLFLQSWGLAATTTISADCEMSIGGSDGSNDGTMWAEEKDATLNTVANNRSVSNKALTLSTGPSTTNAECDADLASVSNGFRLAWTTNDAVAKEICYVAFGSSAVVFEPDEDYWPVRPFPMQAEPVVSVYG